jgi:hypothetical protein
VAAFLGLIEKDIAAGRNVRDRSGTGSFQSVARVCVMYIRGLTCWGAGNIFKPSEVT